ncbi:unnamed protein product [Brachionus calyciflorus]|uniref:Large ribosomal subunit protein uL15m n=1 Tax=Brachionus calyciflorus TaxID=104777 RepID=A0A813NRX9_9BILA|nr:unnamed protein product [Brachionus calyciflorus]
MASVEKALLMLRNLPRVALNNIKEFPEVIKERKKQHALPRGKDAKFKLGADHKGAAQRMSRPRLGFGKSTPGYLRVPKEYYYEGHHLLRQYIPISLLQIQRLIDLGRLNPNEPIDLTDICNTKVLMLDPNKRHFGVQLTDEGADIFKAKVNIEVQWILSELTIAAIEKNGGVVTTKYYDRDCVYAMSDTINFFSSGKPIPKNGTPPLNAIEYYTSASNRGYLANPDEIRVERLKLAQKYGYTLPDLEKDPLKEMLSKRKDPRQIWHGLEPGWLVNLKDQCILKPADKEWIDYYKS